MTSNTVHAFISIILLLCLALFLSSCTQPEEEMVFEFVCGDGVCSPEEIGRCDVDCETGVVAEPETRTTEDILAELRSKQRNYTSDERLNTTKAMVESDKKILVESFTSYLPEKGFRVADRYNLLSINENISDVMGTLTKYQLPEILRSKRLSSNTHAFGPRTGFYEQFLTLRAGRVVFGFDEEEEAVATYLLFEEGEPIIDCFFVIQGGIFKFFEGEIIHFLGHDYIIEEVTNSTMKLIGLTTPDALLFRNNHGAWINNEIITSNTLNVTFTHDYLRVILLAEDEIKILPGKSLREHLLQPEVLLTNRIDVVYEGLTQVPVNHINFKKSSDKYRISFTTNNRLVYDISFAYLNPLKIGTEKNNLLFEEGSDSSDYYINKRDYFIVNNNKEFNGLTNVLRLISISEEDNIITFEDIALEKFVIYFKGTPGVNATGDLIINNVVHKIHVGENESISVDLDGDGSINNDVVPIITAGNGIIKINIFETGDEEIELSYVVPGEMRENSNNDLEIKMIIYEQGLRVDKESLEMLYDQISDSLIGLTDYGSVLVLSDEVDKNEQRGEDLLIQHPVTQRFADVIVKGYE